MEPGSSKSDPAMDSLLDAAIEHHGAGRLAQAEQLYRQILKQTPQHAGALNGLGVIAYQSGAHEFAVELVSHAVALDPLPNYYNNLGLPLQHLARPQEAAAAYLKALALQPDYAAAHFNLGNALKEQDRLAEAVASYQSALRIAPDFSEALCNLGSSLHALGDTNAALASFVRALQLRERPTVTRGFVACVRNIRFSEDNPAIRQWVTRAISEPWGRPADLAAVSAGLIKFNPHISACIARSKAAWPARLTGAALYGIQGVAAIADELLQQQLLENTQVCDLELERYLTNARFDLLQSGWEVTNERLESVLRFYCALARQCFINEYCFDCTDAELAAAGLLREQLTIALKSGKPVPALLVVTVAAYFPLHTLAQAPRLLEHAWPQTVIELLEQQISEPAQELQIRAGISQLTVIDDAVSLQVRQQYEDNPYPRWVKLPRAAAVSPLAEHVRAQFPQAPMQAIPGGAAPEVLVAGCGTGQHAIERAQQIAGARVLAIDLSLASLSYAVRKTRELGVGNIVYAQADIMRLHEIGRSFDLLESVGVLHHLADPMAGWRVLHSLLRPGGLMRLGFYSEAARVTVAAARRFIAEQGYQPVPQDIRRCRQVLIEQDGGARLGSLLSSADFFSISECRDLLFNVQEHRTTLAQISSQLGELGLNLLGFSLAPQVIGKYRQRFPHDQAMLDLGALSEFEQENPDTFAGMYQFWAQKPS